MRRFFPEKGDWGNIKTSLQEKSLRVNKITFPQVFEIQEITKRCPFKVTERALIIHLYEDMGP